MKLKTLTLLLLLHTALCFAQTEKATNKLIAEKFKTYYNARKNEDIFNLFDATMQAALPLEKTKAFLEGLQSQVGNIKDMNFEKYDRIGYASYKTNFDNMLLLVNISIDDKQLINGLLVKPYAADNTPVVARNTTKMLLPFKGEWTVMWGGDTKELNYHVENVPQKNAFDIVIKDKNDKSYKTDGKTNEDYYAFGKEIIAPCDGEVVLVVDGVKDNIPGEMNPYMATGNTLTIKTANNEYIVFAHFKQHSIAVKQGDKVKQGQFLGSCGNSGNSSEPHLHFHLQNVENMVAATGIKCYFDKLTVNDLPKTDYSPIQKERIKQ